MRIIYFSIKTYLFLAITAIIVSLGIYYFLIRPVPEQQKYGIVQDIEFYKKNKVQRKRLNSRKHIVESNYTENARFVYIIKLEDGKTVRYIEYSVFPYKPEYEIGEKLSVTFTLRYIPFYGEKILVYSAEREN